MITIFFFFTARLAHEARLGSVKGRRYQGEVVSIKNDDALCCQRHRKYVLSAFNDYFILTGEFISGLHYRGLAAPRRSSICLSFYRGTVKVVRSRAAKRERKSEEGGGELTAAAVSLSHGGGPSFVSLHGS